jgi:hypothetical protein
VPGSTVSRPVGTSELAFGGTWMATWFNDVSMSGSIVLVAGQDHYLYRRHW